MSASLVINVLLLIEYLISILIYFGIIKMKIFYILSIFLFMSSCFILIKDKNLFEMKTKKTTLLFIIMSIVFLLMNILINNNFNVDILRVFNIVNIISLLIMAKSNDVNMDIFYKVFMIFINILCLFGIYEFIFKYNIFNEYLVVNNGDFVDLSLTTFRNYRVFTIYTHPIVFGNTLIVAFLICKSKIVNIYIRCFSYTLIVINILLTKSRSSWIAFFIVVILINFKKIRSSNRKIKLNKMMLSIFGVIVFIISYIIFYEQFMSVVSFIFNRFSELVDGQGSISKDQRLGAIRFILEKISSGHILNLLFGYGIGSSKNLFANVTLLANIATTDNQFLSIIYDFGIIGFLFFIFISIKVIYVFIKTNSKILSNSCLIYIGIIVNSFFYTIDGWASIMILLALSIFEIINKEKTGSNKSMLVSKKLGWMKNVTNN